MTRVEVPLVEALALDALGERAEATLRVEHALVVAEATGHRLAILQAGARVAPLLEATIRAGTAHRSLAGELLQSLRDVELANAPPPPVSASR